MISQETQMGVPDVSSFLEAFPAMSVRQLQIYMEWIERSLERIDDTLLWARPREGVNSIGNLMLHLEGNIRQWVLHGIGGEEDHRQRDSEFEAEGGLGIEAIYKMLSETVTQVIAVIQKPRTESEWMAPRIIQEFEASAFSAVYHIVEHFAYHTGQIAFLTKTASGEQLGFYDL